MALLSDLDLNMFISCYIMVEQYSRLSLSRIPRDSLKYFDISVHLHIRFAEFRKKMNRTATFNKCMCNLTPEVRDIVKILWNNICYLLLDFHV